MIKCWWRVAWLVVATVVAGCTSAEPVTHPVSGSITLEDGSAINVGLVELVPIGGGTSARGRISVGGGYTVGTYGDQDGALVGEYVVLVSQPQLLVGALRPAPAEHLDEHHEGESPGAGIAPRHYGQFNSSPLRATVVPGENHFDFVLTTDQD